MKETYELIEVRGTEDTIDYVQLAIHFQKNDEFASTFIASDLPSSIDIDSDEDLIIHSALNGIGSGQLRKIRKDAKEQFGELKKSPVIHFSKRKNEVEKIYVQLALIEMNLWSDIDSYICSSINQREFLYLNSSRVWKKTNPIIQKAFSKFDKETTDEVWSLAYQLQKEANIRDIFA